MHTTEAEPRAPAGYRRAAWGRVTSTEAEPLYVPMPGRTSPAGSAVAGLPWWLEGTWAPDGAEIRVRACGVYSAAARVAGWARPRLDLSSQVYAAPSHASLGRWSGFVGTLLGAPVAVAVGIAASFLLLQIVWHLPGNDAIAGMVPYGYLMGPGLGTTAFLAPAMAALAAVWGLVVGGKALARRSALAAAVGTVGGGVVGTALGIAFSLMRIRISSASEAFPALQYAAFFTPMLVGAAVAVCLWGALVGGPWLAGRAVACLLAPTPVGLVVGWCANFVLTSGASRSSDAYWVLPMFAVLCGAVVSAVLTGVLLGGLMAPIPRRER